MEFDDKGKKRGKGINCVLINYISEIPRSSYYRISSNKVGSGKISKESPRKLSNEEEMRILSVINNDRFCDMAPGEIYATLLDEGQYYCSERMMYRILSRNKQNVQRRQKSACNYKRPELLATGPNQLWSWDITKLKGPKKWTYYYLYKIMDVYSRYVVRWMVAYRESAMLAQTLISESCLKHGIERDQLTLHADRGSSMKSNAVGQLLTDLGVTKTHSIPHVSNDNPYLESAFKTLKYRPGFPENFGSIEDARNYCRNFFFWYNNNHKHSGIVMLTPGIVHYNLVDNILSKRQSVLDDVYRKFPQRFVKGPPMTKRPDNEVWLNRPGYKNHVWSYDFVFERSSDGQAMRILNIIDEYSRECLAIHVNRQIRTPEVLNKLSELFISHGGPDYIRSDNGSEFTALTIRKRLQRIGVKILYIEPGSPWENGYIESFNGEFRDELLNGEIFDTILEAKVLTEQWRKHYNNVRPHSSLNFSTPVPEVILHQQVASA